MRPDSFFENGAAAAVRRRALQRALGRRARHASRGWEQALRRYGTWSLGRALAPAIDVAARGLRRRPDLRRPDHAERRRGSTTSRRPRALPRPRRHARKDVGSVVSATPTSPGRMSGSARRGAEGFYRGPVARAIVAAAQAAANGAERRPRLAARPASRAATCAHYRRARARADARRLPRLRRLLDGPAVVGRLDRRRGAEHPRSSVPDYRRVRRRALHYFLEASRYAFADRNAYLARPGVHPRAARRAAVRRFARRAARR